MGNKLESAINDLRKHDYFVLNDGTIVADPIDGVDGFYLNCENAAIEAREFLLSDKVENKGKSYG